MQKYEKQQLAPPHFSAHVYCGQTVAHLSNCWALVKIKNVENLLSMQAPSEISVLHLTNDRLNCSGLLLLSTFFVLLGLLYEGWHLSLSVRRKITVNVFYSTFTNVFNFCHVFTFVNVFLFWGNVFSSMEETTRQKYNGLLYYIERP